MSLIYVCDYCSKTIEKENDRRAVQLVYPATGKKVIKHACKSCFDKYLAPAIFDNLCNAKQSVAKAEMDTAAQNWDKPRVSRESKYFTPDVCIDLHRYIICGAKPIALSEKFSISYQVMRNYVNSFSMDTVPFVCTVDESSLMCIVSKYGGKLIKVKTLLATCTWSLKDISGDTGIDMEAIKVYWENLPWFVSHEELLKEVKEVDYGEDTDN